MHIMHLVTRLLRAGSEENTIATCLAQVQMGHRVTLVHGQEYDAYWYKKPIDGVDLVCLPEMVHSVHVVHDGLAYWALRSLFVKHQPDVIHTHQSKAGILGRMASTVVPDATVVHGIHILPFAGVSAQKRKLYIAAERLAARRTDVFLSVSNAISQAFVDSGITRSDNIHCVRSGMDLNRFKRGRRPADWRALLGLTHTEGRPRVAIMMAAFEPRKRHAPFLRAFAQVADAIPDLKLLLAGQGPIEQQIKDLVVELGLQDRVVFCGHRSDPEALLSLADILVLSSEREGLPRVVVQAIAAGVPVVVNDLPGLQEIVRVGRNGVITPTHDIDETAHQMVRILRDDVALRQLRLGALATDLSAWQLETLGTRTTALYGRSSAIIKRPEMAAE